jgi:hypothetical protein
MTITYPLTFPTTIGLTDSNLKMRTSVSVNESPFSFTQQVYNWQGERWEIDVVLPLMKRAVAEQYKSFLASLKGKFGTFLMYIPSSRENLGNYLDTSKQLLTISGDDITTISGVDIWTSVGEPYCISGLVGSKALTLSGMVASTPGALKAGDYFHIGTGSSTRLYKILKDVNSNSNGEATIDIFPALRRDIIHGEQIELEQPRGLFRLNSNVTEFPSDYNNLFSLSFSAVEAISGT